jgi:ribonuclease BN (tRNA processing enzyme)
MKLTVAGCSPAWPNPGGAQSGYLVEDDGRAVLLDCGPGVLARLRGGGGGGGWPDPDAVVITHFHLDHWGDLVPWVWGALYLGGRGEQPRRPALWVPPGGEGRLEHFGTLLGFPDMFERVFELHEYAPGVAFAAGTFEVTATVVPHYRVGAHALRVVGGGRTLTYSGDSGPAEALVAAASDADLFLCEATLLSGELDGKPRGHLSLDEAREAFEASGAKELLLTHRPVELESPGELEFARDGLVRDV